METFLTFSITSFNNTGINLRFINSYKHLTSSLHGLVNRLLNKNSNIESIKAKFSSLFQYFEDDAIKLLRKGVFRYDYMDKDRENKLKEKQLPNIKYFHSCLNNTKCSVDDHNYVTEIYNYFDFKEIEVYNDLYVKIDVLLLAEVYASYRKKSYTSFGLDPLYSVSASGFSNSAMLKMTGIEIKLITDSNMHLMIEKGIRGG